MIVTVILLLSCDSVFSQYSNYDDSWQENDQIDVIWDINNLVPPESIATQRTEVKNEGIREFSENGILSKGSGKILENVKFRGPELNHHRNSNTEGNGVSGQVGNKDYNFKDIFPQQSLFIDVLPESELITSSNRSPVITFEVTNYKNISLDVIFYCTTQQSLINSLSPTRKTINPQQTIKLQLIISTKSTIYQDEIILTAHFGSTSVDKKVLVDVGTFTDTDTTAPSLDYTFLKDCSKYVFGDCNRGSWMIEVKAKDTQSGVLHVTTNPKGIYFSNSFTAGTNEEVTGTYSDTCCNANLQIIVTDRNGNKKEISTNAFRTRFSRLVDNKDYNSNIFPQQTLFIDVLPGSELITSPNKSPVVIFEVTNYKNITLDVIFYCNVQQSLISSLNPSRSTINPKETIKLQLTLTTRATTYQDEIVLTANSGSETVDKIALMDVGTQTETDTTAPTLDYSFLSDCSKYVFAECSKGSWTLEVTAKDTQSGLLQVITNPKGIYFPKGFISGTKEEVTGTYSESCCNADLQITAIDRIGNKRQISANAFRATWGPGQIAAVVLGVLFLIIIIALAVFFIRKLIKKNRDFSLPTYRGGGGKSTSANYE